MNLFSILVPIFYRFIGITTQQTNTSKVNKIRRILFKILTSIFFLNFLLEFLTNLSCSRSFWGLRNMKPHAFKNSHTEPGSPHPCSSYPPQRRHFLLSYWSLYPVYDGLNVQSFRQMYWKLRDFMSILRWTDDELWLIADPPISLIDSFIDWFKLLYAFVIPV